MADRGLVEPLTGIEPAPPAWKAGVLPLNYSGMVPGVLAHTRTKKQKQKGR